MRSHGKKVFFGYVGVCKAQTQRVFKILNEIKIKIIPNKIRYTTKKLNLNNFAKK